MTRFTLVAYAATKESPCVMSAIIGMLASIPKGRSAAPSPEGTIPR